METGTYYNYSYDYASPSSVGVAAGIMIAYLIVMLIIIAFTCICNWKLFEKAGFSGWVCLIPIYSTFVMFYIVMGSGWKMFLMLIPIVNFVIAIMYSVKMAKAYNKSTGFGIGLIFLPVIFMPILAFSKDAEYQGPQ